MERRYSGTGPGQLTVVGTGPGARDLVTPRAAEAIRHADVIAGYRTYLDLVRDFISEDQEVLSSAMMQEVERCKKALEAASEGRNVALVCGGDPGIYAMAGLVFELARSVSQNSRAALPRIEIIPGIPALSSCAAILGAPLMHDFASVSLSDLLTPWELIEKRIHAAASADFVIVLYNPKSKKRTAHIGRAQEIILEYRDAQTPVGIVSAATRDAESVELTTLQEMAACEINMQTTVIVGNTKTFAWDGHMVTPRGYDGKYRLE